jgi:hypothetical protein
MASLAQFAINIKRRGQSVPRQVNTIVKKVSGAALQAVVSATPVAEGRARGGWLVGLGVANDSSGGLDTSGANTISAGNSVIGQRKPGDQAVFISNNVEYISFLNQGSSAQAPADFVGIAARKASATIRGTRVFK